MKRSFVVRLEPPPGALLVDVEKYILDAVSSWHGCLDPGSSDGAGGFTDGDPMFYLDGASVTVRRYRRGPRVGYHRRGII